MRARRTGARFLTAAAVSLGVLLVAALLAASSLPGPATAAVAVLAAGAAALAWRPASSRALRASGAAGLVLLAPAVVGLSQWLAATPPIRDGRGAVVTGSIASLEPVELRGTRQWLVIRGRDARRPVLLYLSGGPGGSELGLLRRFNPGIEDQVVLVVWEQPGAGKSHGARPASSLRVEDYVLDGLELARLLAARFHQERIFLMGSSWGSILGVKMVRAAPELFHAYLGTGQMTSTRENDLLSYRYAVEMATAAGDQEALAAITRAGPPPYAGPEAPMRYANYLEYVSRYDARLAGTPVGSLASQLLTAVRIPEYGLLDEVNFFRGFVEGMEHIYAGQLGDLDLAREAPALRVPVVLLEGRHDHNAPSQLAGRWFEQLEAPAKELVWFERSAHAPCLSEPEACLEVIARTVARRPAP